MGTAFAHGTLNPQQSRAVRCRETSVVLSSGAGCGKTHVLTERYLSHLETDQVEPGEVVAITFTDRAARQMRDRIRQSLTVRLKQAAGAEEAERWAKHLRGLETAPICTIHAFGVTLLRQHAVEAGLDPHFGVLEDVLASNLEQEALTDSLQRLLTADTPVGEDLRELVLLHGWKPTLQTVQHLMRAENARDWEAWLGRPAEQIAAEWQRFAREDLLPRHVHHLLSAAPKVARCLDLLRRIQPLPGTRMAANVRELLDKIDGLGRADNLAEAVEELTELAKVGGERGKAWSCEEDYQAVKEAFEGFRNELKSRMQLFLTEPDQLTEVAGVGQRFLRVAVEAVRAYQQLKRRHGVVDFQDLLVRARDLLRDHPAIRERLQRRYRYLLIDELQDTDPVQMDLVDYLGGAELTRGKLFAVGDHKQSIYRFRNADSQRFQELRRRVPHEGRLGLTVNYRSQPAILDFTNALMAPHLEDYEPLEAHHPQLNLGPCVEFLWSPRGDKDLANEARALEAEWIARRIAAMVGAGECLVVDRASGGQTLRPVRQGDITLLFRAMTNVALYEAALRRQGLDYYLVGGRAFFAQQEIYDLLNLLRSLENPQDGLSLAGTLRSPFCCLSDESLFLLSRHPEGLWAGLQDDALRDSMPADQRATVERARRFLQRWRSRKDRLPIARLLGEVLADSGYDAALQFEFLGDRKLANLWKMLDLARTFDRSGLFGLAEFIQRLDDLVRTQPREEQAATQPENADVIRLMSIHQAKGLEFPVVFVPDLEAKGGNAHLPAAHWDAKLGCVCRPPAEDPPPFGDFSWRLWEAVEHLEDWAEDLRTLYVACTRAEDYLVLSAALPKSFQPANAWMLTLADRFDLTTGACRDHTLAPEKRPRVRVIDQLRSAEQRKLTRTGQESTYFSGNVTPAEIGPLPPQLIGQELLTVAQVESFVRQRRQESGGAQPLRLMEWADQFDEEDGAGRTNWVEPLDRIQPPGCADDSTRERLLRAVLERWDYQDPEEWQPILDQLLTVLPRPETSPSLRKDLERSLARFAASDTFRELSGAKTCYRDLEFLLAGEEPSVRVRGVIDCFWQDAERDWHLLFYCTRLLSARERQTDWRAWETGLVLAARAVRKDLGAWPKSFTLYYFDPGQAVRHSGQSLQQRRVQAAVDAALSDFPGQTLSSY